MVRKELLENFVLDNIIKILHKPQIMECVVSNIMQAQNNQSNNMSLLNTLNKDKKQAEFALQNVMKAVEQGIINNTTNK